MKRDQWYEHLLHGTGPLAIDALEKLKPAHELVELLRELIVLPWPEHDDPERDLENDAPFYAMLLLGLLRDEASIGGIIEVVGHAVEEDWDAVVEIGPPTLAAIGPKALPAVLAELERLEREEMLDAREIEKKDLDPNKLYRYNEFVIAVEQIGLNHPETHGDIAAFAASRLRDTRYDRPAAKSAPARKQAEDVELPTVTELWADLQISLRLSELTPLVEDFFERHGPHYQSMIFGDRAEFEELMATEAPTGDARARIIDLYEGLRAADDDDDEDDDEDDEEEENDDDDEDDEEYEEPIEPYVRPEPKVGRNDPCPCGSGKKYKKCHGA